MMSSSEQSPVPELATPAAAKQQSCHTITSLELLETPEQALQKSRSADPAYINIIDIDTPSTNAERPAASTTSTTTTTSTGQRESRDWGEVVPLTGIIGEDSLLSLQEEAATGGNGGGAGFHFSEEEFAAALSAKASLEAQVTALQQELAQQHAKFVQRLEAEHALASVTLQQASEVACSLRDVNVQMVAELEQLRARVAQLESLEADVHAYAALDMNEEGNEQLIAALQVEMSQLERQVHKANRARISASETEEAALQRSEILQQQVEQMAKLLEEERDEKLKLQEALKTVGVLPS